MKNTRFLLCALTLGILLVSCENLLEVDVPVSQTPSSLVFESTETADAALSHLYTEMQAYSLLNGGQGGAGALLGSYTDDLINYDNYSQNGDMDIYENVQGASNISIKSFWTQAYSEIYTANAIITGIEKSVGINEGDRRRIKGEALFVRTLIYYYLNQLFGDIPYTVTTDYTYNQSVKKTSSAEVQEKIQEDLYMAVALLNDEYRNPERIYPNRKTAELLLATVLMTRYQYGAAEALLRGVIDSPLYQWQPDVRETFKKTGSHILWQLKPLYASAATNEALLYYFESSVPTLYSLSGDLISSFSAGDLRKQWWTTGITVEQTTYYRPGKYTRLFDNTDEYSIVFRLEEAYLLLAEALAQQGKLSEAMPYLNAVKEKAGVSPAAPTLTKEQLLDEILAENRKEFFTERGIRFTTLKRLGRLTDLVMHKPQWKPHHELWPLPFSELSLNPNLNPQNNGY